jgi:hypothetical protein
MKLDAVFGFVDSVLITGSVLMFDENQRRPIDEWLSAGNALLDRRPYLSLCAVLECRKMTGKTLKILHLHILKCEYSKSPCSWNCGTLLTDCQLLKQE